MEKLISLIQKLFQDPAPKPQPVEAEYNRPVKFPFFKTIFEPFSLFVDNVRTFFTLGLVYALILSAVALLFMQGYMCLYGDFRAVSNACTNNVPFYTAGHIVVLFIICMFMGRWYGMCFQSRTFSWRYILLPNSRDIKTFGAVILFALLNLLSVLSFYLLYIRVPNPDWRIEIIYFGVVSIGFLVPFFLIRFYSVLAFILSGEPVPPLTCIWKRGSGNTLKILLSLSLIFFITIFALFAFMNNFRLVDVKNAVYIITSAEYFYNLLILLLMVFFVNHCYMQKTFLFEGKQDGQ